MKILVVSHQFPNPQQPTNGTFVYYHVKALKKLGNDVVVIAPVPYVLPGIPKTHRWYKFKHIPNMLIDDGIKIYYPRFLSIPKRKLLFLRGILVLWSSLPFYTNLMKKVKFDVIHCHQIIPNGHVGYLLNKRYKIPYGITIHGYDIYANIHLSKKNYKLIKFLAENASFLGVVSHKFKELIISNRINLHKEKTKIIYNGINIPDKTRKIKWDDSKNNVIRLLSVGHAVKRKGYDYVLRAISRLRNKHPNLVYYIIGEGIDLSYFRNVARQEKVEDITYFLGQKNNTEVMNYMKHCDIFVLPSWNEAFGVVYIEAMYMKKIVVGCEGEGIAEIITDGQNGFLVESKNVLKLTEKLDYIISNINNLQRVGENAFRTVWPKFSWENNAKQYVSLYNNILKYI